VLAQVPKGSAEMVAATIRTNFAQSGPAQVREQLGVIAGMLGPPVPRVEAMLHDAAHDITAFAAFPVGHCKRIWPADPWSG
jgi:putative transposase